MLSLLQAWHDDAQSWVIHNAMFHPGRVLLLMILLAASGALLVMLIPKGRRNITARDRAQARDAAVQAAKKHLLTALQQGQSPKQADLDLINGEFMSRGGILMPSHYVWSNNGDPFDPRAVSKHESTQRQQTPGKEGQRDAISGLTREEIAAAQHHKPGERQCLPADGELDVRRRPSTGMLPTVANPAHPAHKSIAELNKADLARAVAQAPYGEAVRLVPRDAPAPRVGVRDPLNRLRADMLADASQKSTLRARIASGNIEVLRMKAAFFAREAVRAHIHAQSEFVNAQEQQRLSDYYTLRADRLEKFTEDVA